MDITHAKSCLKYLSHDCGRVVFVGIGLLHGAGLTDLPHQRQPTISQHLTEFSNATLKYHE